MELALAPFGHKKTNTG